MKKLSEYVVQFEGLKTGSHRFDWEVDEKFFEDFGDVEFGRGKFHVELDLQKENTMLILNFHIHGSFSCSCDLCLEEIHMPVEHEDRLIVKFGSGDEEPDAEIIFLRHGEYEIDLRQPIYEIIATSVPFRRTCADVGKTCDPEMLRRIGQPQGTTLESENQAEEGESPWDILKSLKNKEKK